MIVGVPEKPNVLLFTKSPSMETLPERVTAPLIVMFLIIISRNRKVQLNL